MQISKGWIQYKQFQTGEIGKTILKLLEGILLKKKKAEGVTVHCNVYVIKTGWEIALKMITTYLLIYLQFISEEKIVFGTDYLWSFRVVRNYLW